MQNTLHEPNDFRTKSLLVACWAVALGCLYVGVTNTTHIIEIAGFNLHTLDIAVATAIVPMSLSVRSRINRGLPTIVTLIFCSFLTASILSGGLLYGNPAFLEGRLIVPVVIWLLIFCFPWDERTIERLVKISIKVSLALSLLCFFRVAFGNQLFVDAGVIILEADSDRPLIGTPAMMLGFSCIAALSIALNASSQRVRRRNVAIFAFMFFALIASQQRTAIIASVLGIATFYVLQIGRVRVARFLAVISAVGVVVTILLFFVENVGFEGLLQMMPRSIQAMFGEHTTYTWREKISEELLIEYVENWDLYKQLFGSPAGSSFTFFAENTDEYFTVTPHNGYIYFLARSGALGVACLIILFLNSGFSFLSSARRGSQGGMITPAFQVAITVTMATWFQGYTLSPEHILFFCIAMGLLLRSPKLTTLSSPNYKMTNPLYTTMKIGNQK